MILGFEEDNLLLRSEEKILLNKSNIDQINKPMERFFESNLITDDDSDDVETTTATTTEMAQLNQIKICVSLSPGYVSTRKLLINYECQARICSDLSPESVYQFGQPIFDWKTDLQHMVSVNGSCDQSRTVCQYRLEVNVGNFVNEMDAAGLKEMKISCNVADFVHIGHQSDLNHNRYHYISGQADALIKHFKGSRIHQHCNQTNECAENMFCNPNPISKDTSSYYGYCECPNESLQILQSGTDVKLNEFTLIIDHHYDELICARKRSLNESCHYDQQCSTMDKNSYCRPIYSIHGFSTSSSICDCSFGYVPDQNGRCISVYSVQDDSHKDESNYHLREYTSIVPKGVYIWWIITRKPNITQTADRIASTYRFLWQRYSLQRNLTQMLMMLLLFLPFIILIISSAYLHYYRRMMGQRQYKPPRAQTIHSGLNFGEHPTDFAKPISLSSVVELDPVPNNKKSPLSTDKIELVKNDDLDQYYQIRFQ